MHRIASPDGRDARRDGIFPSPRAVGTRCQAPVPITPARAHPGL